MAKDITSASPEALNLANRLDTLSSNGHGYLDPLAQINLAQNGGSTATMLNNAAIFKQAAVNTGQGPTDAWNEAHLNVKPGAVQTAADTLHNTHGPLPVYSSDVTEIQKNLQAKGYAQGLPVGTWNSQWQSALSQHATDAMKKPGIGNVKSLPLWHNILNEIAPSTWMPTVTHAVANYMHSLPGDLRQMIADVAGEAGNYYDPKNFVDLLNPKISKEEQAAFQSRTASRTAAIEKALGGKVDANGLTPSQVNARAAKDLGNLLNLVLLKGAGGAVFSSAGKLGAAYLATDAAAEGGLAAVKGLVTRSLPASMVQAPRFTVVKSLYQAGAEGEKGTGVLRAMENIPVLKRALPVIDALDAEGSKYFAFKNFLAQNARIPALQAANILESKGMLAGLGLLATTEGQKLAGATPQFDATTVKPYSGALGNAVDFVGTFTGAPSVGLKATQNVGKVVSGAHEAYSNAIGTIGIDHAIKEGLGISLDTLKKNLGEEFTNDHFINTKLNQYSASNYAELATRQMVYDGKLDRNSPDYLQTFQQYEHEALTNPEILSSSRDSLIAQPSVLADYYRKDFGNVLGLNVRRGANFKLDGKDKTRFFDQMNQLKAAHEPMSVMLQDEHRNLFHGSATMVGVQDMLTKGLSEDWAKKAPGFDDLLGKPDGPRLFHINNKVNEFAPDPASLVRPTPYGSGVTSTDNAGIAGRVRGTNIYALRHNPVGGELPKFYDMTKAGNGQPLAEQIRTLIGGTIDAPAGAFANSTVRQYRDELGLMMPGKAEGALVNIDKKNYPEVYKNLRKVLNNQFDYNGQQVLDAYRAALRVGGKLSGEQVDERINQVTQAALKEKAYTGFIYKDAKYGMQTVINPDRAVATMIQQDPKWTKESLIPGYLTDNNVVERGALGIARKETFVAQDAQKAANRLFDYLSENGYTGQVEAARSTLEFEERNKVVDQALPSLDVSIGKVEARVIRDAREILINKFGKSANEVSRLDPLQAVSQIWRESRKLASEAYLPIDAPKHLQDAVARLKEMGYRPVLGTDIGHAYERPIIEPAIVNQRTSLLRKAALRLGIDPSKVSDLSVAQTRRAMVERQVNKLFVDGIVSPTFGDNGNSIYNILSQAARGGVIMKEGRIATGFRNAFAGLNQTRLDAMTTRLLGDTSNMTDQELVAAKAAAATKSQEIFNSQHQIRDLSLKQMVKALTRPVDPKDVLGDLAPRYSQEDAMKIAKAVLVGYAKTPTSVLGLGKTEDVIRASGAIASNATASFFGKVPVLNKLGIGEGPLINTLAALPNDLLRLRDKWRFEFSPVFAARRLAKTNVKAATEGVPVTSNPYEAMNRQNITDEAFKILDRTAPEVYKASKELEPLDKFLQQNDVFGIFNPAHMMAWQAYHLNKLGLSDEEVAAKLVKINTYGDRTPLERTVNTIFYPFSFNKTLYRNVGGWLLDHTGEAILIDHAFNLYQHYDPNNEFGAWVKKHAPLLTELNKLNAFEHGTGLGQFGGINAPYINEIVNLFSPQQIIPQNASAAIKAWNLAIPALGELNSLLFNYTPSTGTADFKGALVEQGKVGFWAAQNLIQHATDLATNQKRAVYQTTLTDSEQVKAGIDTVTSMKVQLAKLLGTGYKWPDKEDIPKTVRGLKFDSQSIEMYANALYPAYKPGAAVGIAATRAADAVKYVQELRGTFRFEAYNAFQAVANKTVSKLRSTNDPASIEKIAVPLREAAVNLAEQDPKFASFYKRYYASMLGPIEGLSK
jgi:hypothetical protein